MPPTNTHVFIACDKPPLALPYLLSLVVTTDPRLRHGALCAVGEVTSSLYSLHSQSFPAGLGEKLVLQLVDVVPQVMTPGILILDIRFLLPIAGVPWGV